MVSRSMVAATLAAASTLAAPIWAQEPDPARVDRALADSSPAKVAAARGGPAPIAPSREFVARHPQYEKLLKEIDVQYQAGELLGDVLDDLSKRSGATIVVDWDRLDQDEAVGRESPLPHDARFGRMTTRNALHHLLRGFRATVVETPRHAFVTTVVESETKLAPRVHSVGDLLVAGRTAEPGQLVHPYRDHDDAVHRRLAAALREKISVDHPPKTPLAEIFGEIGARLPGGFVVDWDRLDQDEALDPGVALNDALKLEDASIEAVLEEVGRRHRLAWHFERGAVVVTTRVELETREELFVFPAADLLHEVRADLLLKEDRVVGATDQATGDAAAPAGGAATAREAANREDETPRFELDSPHLLRAVREATSPRDSWDDMGGPGSIQVFGPTLDLCGVQTIEIGKQVETLLGELRGRPIDPVWGASVRPAQPRGIDPTRPGGGTAFDELIGLIRATTTPRDAWDDRGGPGTITPVPATLAMTVVQTKAVHEAVEDLLLRLRRGRWVQVNGSKPWEL